MVDNVPRRSAENIGMLDRAVRVFGGVILLIEEQKMTGVKGTVMQGVGFYVLFTGILRTCFAYHIMNIRTNGKL